MRIRPNTLLAILVVGIATFVGSARPDAQEELQELPRISLKSGESVELRNAFSIRNCRSILSSENIASAQRWNNWGSSCPLAPVVAFSH